VSIFGRARSVGEDDVVPTELMPFMGAWTRCWLLARALVTGEAALKACIGGSGAYMYRISRRPSAL
jgi:hypothetical protein